MVIVNKNGKTSHITDKTIKSNEDGQDKIDDKVDLLEEDDEIPSRYTKIHRKWEQLKFNIKELSSEIDEESYLNFSCDIEVQNLSEQKSFCEYQLILLQGR